MNRPTGDVSVVIVSWNVKEALACCLESLERFGERRQGHLVRVAEREVADERI